MKTIELNESEMNHLRVLFKVVEAATDPSLIATKSAVFVDKTIIRDMANVWATLGQIGTWDKLLKP